LPASPLGLKIIGAASHNHQSFSPKLWNDAYLAAFALAAQLEVVSFDTGFAQFKGVKCLIPP
jgi:predicted nucleic acid-binding protein